jgi:mono/diheme cytochrome c family protein
MRVSSTVLMGLMVAAGAGTAEAQANGGQRTTAAGVYTPDQANRGRDVYAMQCKSCHTPASHTGAIFAAWWDRKTLADLYQFIATRMPKNEPGSLQADEYVDVTAYLLKLNELPSGTDPMPADTVALKRVRIEVGKRDP